MATHAFSRPNAMAIARPIPFDAPVTKTGVPVSSVSMAVNVGPCGPADLEETARTLPAALSMHGCGSKMSGVTMLEAHAALISGGVPALARFVERFEVWTPRHGETRRLVDLLPDGGASLVVRVFEGGAYEAGVRGPRTRAHYKVAAALPLMVRVLFRPGGAYPFFGVPMDTLADAMAPLDVLWQGHERAFRDDLLAAHAAKSDVTAVIARHLIARMRTRPFEPVGAIAARAAVGLLARGESLDDVARTVGVSGRHLRRAFRATVGLNPKTYARIARFQRAFELGRRYPGRWADVARAAGYFDQSHLTADFRDLALVSPASRAEHPARRDC
jgi:AraC-like DNA-binding protein